MIDGLFLCTGGGVLVPLEEAKMFVSLKGEQTVEFLIDCVCADVD